jgi:3-polyprenyl-4-hydroxybenzoate decarboxylase
MQKYVVCFVHGSNEAKKKIVWLSKSPLAWVYEIDYAYVLDDGFAPAYAYEKKQKNMSITLSLLLALTQNCLT